MSPVLTTSRPRLGDTGSHARPEGSCNWNDRSSAAPLSRPRQIWPQKRHRNSYRPLASTRVKKSTDGSGRCALPHLKAGDFISEEKGKNSVVGVGTTTEEASRRIRWGCCIMVEIHGHLLIISRNYCEERQISAGKTIKLSAIWIGLLTSAGANSGVNSSFSAPKLFERKGRILAPRDSTAL